MTSQIVVLNKKRSFVLSESASIVDEFKSYVGEEKVFKISEKLSTVVLVSGNGRFNGEKLKNYIAKYLAKTNMDNIQTVDEVKNTLNECISQSSGKMDVNEYINNTFPEFEKSIQKINENHIVEYLKLNSSNEDIDVLKNNKLLNNRISKLINSRFSIDDKIELDKLKFYLRRCYYDYLIKSSTNLVIVGYDDKNEYPTFFKYSILFNNDNGLEIVEGYSLKNYKGTIIFAIAQNQDIYLNLTGFNDKTYYDIENIVVELFQKYANDCDEIMLNSIKKELEHKIYNIGLENIGLIIGYIDFLPDRETLKLLEKLIELTSYKKKFSNEPHSVSEDVVKLILRKYDGIKVFE